MYYLYFNNCLVVDNVCINISILATVNRNIEIFQHNTIKCTRYLKYLYNDNYGVILLNETPEALIM